jgi:ribosomal silencing factor RsfS
MGLIEKKVVISSSMSSKIIEFLENYKGEDLQFTYVNNTSQLNAAFIVKTTESDNQKLARKIKDLIKSTSFGSVLYFSVHAE